MKGSVLRGMFISLVVLLIGMSSAWADGEFYLQTPLTAITPDETFAVGVFLTTDLEDVQAYKISISYPSELAVPLWTNEGMNVLETGFNRPLTHDLVYTKNVILEERHDGDACADGTDLHIADIVFFLKDSAPPLGADESHELTITVEEVIDCDGNPVTGYFLGGALTASVLVEPPPETTTGLSQYLDLDGDGDFDVFDAAEMRFLVEGEIGNTSDMPLNVGGLQGDIGGNGLADPYDVGLMEAIAVDIEYLHTGPDGIADTVVAFDDVERIPFGQGEPYALAITWGSNSTQDTMSLGEDDTLSPYNDGIPPARTASAKRKLSLMMYR